MRVVYFTQVDLTGSSGQNLYSRSVALALARRSDVDLSLVCPEPSGRLPDPLRTDDVATRYVPAKVRNSPRWHLSCQLPGYRALVDLHRQDELDGIVTTLKPSTLAPAVLALRYGVPEVLLVEGMLVKNVKKDPPFPGAWLPVSTVVALNAYACDHAFTAYEEARDWIASYPGLKEPDVTVASHGVDTETFVPQPLERARERLDQELPADATVVGFVGSFKPYHCLEPLVEAVARSRNDGNDVRLLLVGDGPERESIERRVRDLGIEESVTFTGFVDHSRVPVYVAASDLLYGVIDPEHWGSPMKVYEYLACGRPVIAFNDDALAFIETIDAGVLVDDVSVEDVSDAISRLRKSDPSTWIEASEAARAYILANQTWDTYVADVVDELRRHE